MSHIRTSGDEDIDRLALPSGHTRINEESKVNHLKTAQRYTYRART